MNTKKKEIQELTDKNDGNPPSSNAGDFSALKTNSHEKAKEDSSIAQNNVKKGKKSKEASPKKHSKKIRIPWIVAVFFITLLLSFVFGMLAQLVIGEIKPSNVFIAYVLVLIIVLISIISDMIGVAATSCDIEPFYAMSARKVKGAKLAVKLTKNANVVSSVSCDVIGDICGIISGACGAAIVAVMTIQDNALNTLISVICSTVIAAIMITGKALGKKMAIKNANKIIFFLAKTMSIFSKK